MRRSMVLVASVVGALPSIVPAAPAWAAPAAARPAAVAPVVTGTTVLFYARATGATAELVRRDGDGTESVVESWTGSGATSYRIIEVTASPAADRVAYELLTWTSGAQGASLTADDVYVGDFDNWLGTARVRVSHTAGADGWHPSVWSSDGRGLWLWHDGGYGIYVYDTATGARHLLPGGAHYVMGRPDPADPGAFYAPTGTSTGSPPPAAPRWVPVVPPTAGSPVTPSRRTAPRWR